MKGNSADYNGLTRNINNIDVKIGLVNAEHDVEWVPAQFKQQLSD